MFARVTVSSKEVKLLFKKIIFFKYVFQCFIPSSDENCNHKTKNLCGQTLVHFESVYILIKRTNYSNKYHVIFFHLSF